MKKPILLFQGDSNTDWNRIREDFYDLGGGYVPLIQDAFPHVLVLNRGVSGDRTTELLARWHKDCLELQPDYLSIFVGINEVWHKYIWDKPMTTRQFEENYRQLLELVKKNKPTTKVLLMSPFVFPIGDYNEQWMPDLIEETRIVEELSKEYNTLFIHMQQFMDSHLTIHSMQELTYDGVHPTPLGFDFISKEIIQQIKNHWNL
jgi:acyl-CoA thioesterase-1